MLARAAALAMAPFRPNRGKRTPVRIDPRALAAIGIDLDEVRRSVEESFGPGALERTRAAYRRR
jgi:hypothetical protein